MDTTENDAVDMISATVHELQYMPVKNVFGERLWILIYVGDIAGHYDPNDFERMGEILRDLPGASYTEGRDRGSYTLEIPVSSLPELRTLAERWPTLAFAISHLEVTEREAVQHARQKRWDQIRHRDKERYMQMMGIRNLEQDRINREAVLTLAKALGWRNLTFGPAMTCGGTETAWRTFAIQGSFVLIHEALRQLRSEVDASGQKGE